MWNRLFFLTKSSKNPIKLLLSLYIYVWHYIEKNKYYTFQQLQKNMRVLKWFSKMCFVFSVITEVSLLNSYEVQKN